MNGRVYSIGGKILTGKGKGKGKGEGKGKGHPRTGHEGSDGK